MNDLANAGQRDAVDHPAYDLADRIRGSAEELPTYLNPGNDFPRTLTRDDHTGLLLCMQEAIEELAAGISYIYRAATDARASEQLGAAVELTASDDALPPERRDKAEQVSGRAGGSLSGAPWDQSDARTPQALAAANFLRGPAGSLRPGSGIEDSSSQSANSARPGRAGAGHPGRTR